MNTLHQTITQFIDFDDEEPIFRSQFYYTISFKEDPTAPLRLPTGSFERHHVDLALGGAYKNDKPPITSEYLCTLRNEAVIQNLYRVVYDVPETSYEAPTASKSAFVIRAQATGHTELGINAFRLKSHYNPLETICLDRNGASLMEVISYSLFNPLNECVSLQELIESPLLDEYLATARMVGY